MTDCSIWWATTDHTRGYAKLTMSCSCVQQNRLHPDGFTFAKSILECIQMCFRIVTIVTRINTMVITQMRKDHFLPWILFPHQCFSAPSADGSREFLTGMFEPGMLNQILIVCAQPREETLFHTNISAHYDNCHVLEYPTVVVYRHSLETVSHR